MDLRSPNAPFNVTNASFFAGSLASEALSNEHGEAEDFIVENCRIITKHWYSNVLPLTYPLNWSYIVLFINGIKKECD